MLLSFCFLSTALCNVLLVWYQTPILKHHSRLQHFQNRFSKLCSILFQSCLHRYVPKWLQAAVRAIFQGLSLRRIPLKEFPDHRALVTAVHKEGEISLPFYTHNARDLPIRRLIEIERSRSIFRASTFFFFFLAVIHILEVVITSDGRRN